MTPIKSFILQLIIYVFLVIYSGNLIGFVGSVIYPVTKSSTLIAEFKLKDNYQFNGDHWRDVCYSFTKNENRKSEYGELTSNYTLNQNLNFLSVWDIEAISLGNQKGICIARINLF